MNDTPYANGGIIPSAGSDHVLARLGPHESVVSLTDMEKFHAGELSVEDLLQRSRPHPTEEDVDGGDPS